MKEAPAEAAPAETELARAALAAPCPVALVWVASAEALAPEAMVAVAVVVVKEQVQAKAAAVDPVLEVTEVALDWVNPPTVAGRVAAPAPRPGPARTWCRSRTAVLRARSVARCVRRSLRSCRCRSLLSG